MSSAGFGPRVVSATLETVALEQSQEIKMGSEMNETFQTKRFGRSEIVPEQVLAFEARLAVNMIEKWGSVVGMPSGEDSAGRQKLRAATPKEVVTHAFGVACELVKQAHERGLVLELEPAAEEA